MGALCECLLFLTVLGIISARSVINMESMNTYNLNKSLEGIVKIPGGIYTQSLKRVKIPPLLKGFNDVETRWLAYDSWIFHTTFNVTKEQKEYQIAKLVLEGVDTVASVKLNGVNLGNTNNMFVRYAFYVKDLLKTDIPNNLTIQFVASTRAALERSNRWYTAPDCVPSTYHGECHANQLRKMQMAFGWDWGPAFPSMGLWKPVFLEFYDSLTITSVSVNTILQSKDRWTVNAIVYYESKPGPARSIEGVLIVDFKEYKNRQDVKLEVREDGKGQLNFSFAVPEGSVELWWPNGAGKQSLYDLNITIGSKINHTDVANKKIRIGFRTIELVERNVTELFPNTSGHHGLSFYFKVNGVPIFMKGTNWIPVDALPENTRNESRINDLLLSVRDTHMNMIRVWGGGIYESDYFYDRCDELGILVWQDFMFACSMYPTDVKFLSSVKEEISQTVLRLQHHVSIALWAGNNENEAALRSNWYGTKNDFDRYKVEYIKLYVETIMPLVKSLDPGRSYITSSPTNGLESIREGYIADNPYDPHYGDTHYYNYLADNWNQNTVPLTRFASEYGIQSVPSRKTMISAIQDPSDLNIGSTFMKHRQHAPAGYEFIKMQFEKRMGSIESADFNKFAYYSQISQAMSIKSLTEFFRQSQRDWFTMGALYWQLNDVWQAPSWSSIEYDGKWKMLHYFARSFFSPILISPRLLSTGKVDVYVLNDGFKPLNNVQILVDIFKWSSLTPLRTFNYTIETVLQTNSTKVLQNMDFLGNDTKNEIFWRFRLKLKESEGNELSNKDIPYNFIFPVPLKSVTGLRKPTIQIQVDSRRRASYKNYTYDLLLRVDSVILFLWLESSVDGRFSDNGIIVTEPAVQLSFTSAHYFKYEKDLVDSITYQFYLNF